MNYLKYIIKYLNIVKNTFLHNNNLPGKFCTAIASGFWTIPLLTLLKMCSKSVVEL